MNHDAARAGLRIVLVRPKSSENVGAAARAMKNFGLGELVLVAPRCRIDTSARALASHAGDVLDRATVAPDLGEALRGVRWAVGTSARPRASETVRHYPPDDGLATVPDVGGALVFGPEDHGLSNEELDRCQALIQIPTADYASINLAQSVNILAHRWFERRHRGEVGPDLAKVADRDQVERMFDDLVALWHLIGFTDERREAPTLRLFRGLLDRAVPTPREVAALRGLISQAAWAAKRDPDRLPGRSQDEPTAR